MDRSPTHREPAHPLLRMLWARQAMYLSILMCFPLLGLIAFSPNNPTTEVLVCFVLAELCLVAIAALLTLIWMTRACCILRGWGYASRRLAVMLLFMPIFPFPFMLIGDQVRDELSRDLRRQII